MLHIYPVQLKKVVLCKKHSVTYFAMKTTIHQIGIYKQRFISFVCRSTKSSTNSKFKAV